MDSLVVAAVVMASTLGGLFLGVSLRAVLPDPHLSSDSKDAIKMGTGLVATLTGLVLGLLTASAKSSYDAQRANLQLLSANVVLLDRALAQIGPEASVTRGQLHKTVASYVEHLWPADAYQPAGMNDPTVVAYSTAMMDAIRNLPAGSESQRSMKAQALQLSVDLSKTRWQLNRWDNSSIPVAFLVVLNFWLAVLFLTFGLFTPRNGTVIAILFVCALSVAGALFLIVELDQPFAGFIRVSSAPLNNALGQIGK